MNLGRREQLAFKRFTPRILVLAETLGRILLVFFSHLHERLSQAKQFGVQGNVLTLKCCSFGLNLGDCIKRVGIFLQLRIRRNFGSQFSFRFFFASHHGWILQTSQHAHADFPAVLDS